MVFVYRASAAQSKYDSVLENNTWEQIAEASAAGEVPDTWAVGDTHPITLNGAVGNYTFNNFETNAFILGINHNAAVEGNNLIHFGIGLNNETLIALTDNNYPSVIPGAGYFHMNNTNSNVGGWEESYMRTTLLGNSNTPENPLSGSLIAALPEELRAVMKPCSKWTDNTGNGINSSGNVTATQDYLSLLAEFEVHGERTHANQYEQNHQLQYDYFKNGGNKSAHQRIDSGDLVYWASRSPHSNSVYYFCGTDVSGTATLVGTRQSIGLVVAFYI